VDLTGIGIDHVPVAEFERLAFDENVAFYQRCFSPDEIAYCRSQAESAQHFAARFAAKEAAVKAFSPVAELAYWQIEVSRAPDGAPFLRLWNADRTAPASNLQDYAALVSLSHTHGLAIAMVAVGKKGELI
jgi:holo-[acyl-carrier protein] synthase